MVTWKKNCGVPENTCGSRVIEFTDGEKLMLRMLFGLGMAALLTISAHATASPSCLYYIIKRGTLRVGMTGDYLPFTYLDKTTSKFRGFDVDMAEALGKALGVKIESATPHGRN